jgi:hypothetical protein
MLTPNDGRSELWQWDTGRKLTVDADCTQVHFSNKVFGRSIDVDVVDGTAEIPDILLQVDKELHVWAFVGTAENGYTKISKVFRVNKRNKPADYVFTPLEQMTLEKILERIERLEENPDAVVDPVAKTDDMTNPVGVDPDGLLWTAPSGGGEPDLLDENGILKQEYLPEGFPYKSGREVEILPETTLYRDASSGRFYIPEGMELSAGMECVIRFTVPGMDYEMEYKSVCRELPANQLGGKWGLGNLSIMGMGEDTGEPFAIGALPMEMVQAAGMGGMMVSTLSLESVTVTITALPANFSFIDPGYIEHGTVLVRVIGDISSGDFTASHTGKEIDKLLNDGKVVVLEHMKSADSILRTVYTLSSRQKGVAVEFRNMDVFTDHIEVNDIHVSVYDNAWYRTGVRAQATVL